MKFRIVEKFSRWYLHRYYGDQYFTLADVEPALKQAKEKECERLSIIHTADKAEIERLHQLDIQLVKAEAAAEADRMNAEMALLMQKVMQAQDVYYETVKKAKITNSVVADANMQFKHIRDLVSSISGCMEGIQARAKELSDAFVDSEESDRKRLSLQKGASK